MSDSVAIRLLLPFPSFQVPSLLDLGGVQVGPVAPQPVSAGAYDVILLCAKSFHTQEACRRVKGLLAPQGLIISVQNGLGNLEIIAREFGPERTSGPG